MKATERTFYFGVIMALSIVIILLRGCQPKCKPCEEMKLEPIEVTAIDTVLKIVHDSSEWHKPQEARKPQILTFSTPDDQRVTQAPEMPKNDSSVISDWHLARFYSDTNCFETGNVVVEAMVTKNRLGTLRVLSNVKEKTVTIEKTITQSTPVKPRGQLYFGLLAQGDQTNLLTDFGVSGLWKTKRDKIWSLSVLYDRRFQTPVYQLGTFFKLSFK